MTPEGSLELFKNFIKENILFTITIGKGKRGEK